MVNKVSQVLELDFWQEEFPPLRLQQGEAAGRVLEFQIFDYGKEFDITGYKVEFQAIRPDGQAYTGPCTIINASKGRFNYEVEAVAVASEGEMRGQIAFSQGGVTLRSRVLLIHVLESVDTEGAILDTELFAELRRNLRAVDEVLSQEKAVLALLKNEYNTVKTTVEGYETTAENSAAGATQSATEARGSADEAKEYARQAKGSASEALTQARASKLSADNAKSSETLASNSKASAIQSATQAEEAKSLAKTSEDNARQSATLAQSANTESKQSAAQAKASETEATRQASIATTKAEEVATSVGRASVSEAAAKSSAERANASASASAESARQAKISENTSAESAKQANLATTRATTAKSETETLKSEVQSIRDGIVTTENERQIAETDRVANESVRIDQEAARVEADKTRATRAQLDHQISVQDHAQHTAMIQTIESLETGQLVSDVGEIKQSKADKTYVDGRFEQLIGSAPEALDTLEELASALGGQADFATQITNQLADKASKTELADRIGTAKKGLQTQIDNKVGNAEFARELAGKVGQADYNTRVQTVDDLLANKVDKMPGKGLSSADYTQGEKDKLADIEKGATKTIIVNSLTSSSADKALSGIQGKILNDKVTETNSNIGNLKKLTTVAKSDLVKAINEVNEATTKGGGTDPLLLAIVSDKLQSSISNLVGV